MTGQPPPSRDRALGFDEFIAILVAFAAIGSILFWGLTRRDAGFQLGDLFPRPTATTRPTLLPPRPEADRLSPSPTVRTTPSPFVVPETSPSPRAAQRGTVGVVPSPSAPGIAPVPVPVVVAPSPTAEPVEFADVPPDYWAYPFIADLSLRGIITGFEDGTFRPEDPVTRAQYAAFIENILSSQQQEAIDFTDVPADFWARPAITEAVQAGFLRGYPEGNFAPDDPISKVQVLASLTNGMQLPEATNPEQAVVRYEDSDQIPDWAIPVVASATESGVVVNYPNPNQLGPNQAVTRAEVAAMLYQALEAIGQVDPIQSEYIVQP
jgi:hypothetical protein